MSFIVKKILGALILLGLFEWTAWSLPDPWMVHKVVGTLAAVVVLFCIAVALLASGGSGDDTSW